MLIHGRDEIFVKPMNWGWSTRGLMNWAVLALWLGHGIWVVQGRGSGVYLRRSLDLFTGPSQWVSMRWEQWKVNRAQQVRDLSAAQAELGRLRSVLAELQLKEAREAPERAEAREAIRLLGLRQALGLDLRAARILFNNRKAPFSGMVIEPAAGPSLLVDQGVIAAEGVVGRIWSASPQQASVLPLDAYNASTAVMLGRSRATGVLQGTGPGRAEIRFISTQEVVQAGEPVYTSGLDRVFPRGLLVGYVKTARSRDIELQVEVGLAAPLDRLHLVYVLPPAPPLEIDPPAAPAGSPDVKRGLRL
jgi:rod shape-determining protein MreC